MRVFKVPKICFALIMFWLNFVTESPVLEIKRNSLLTILIASIQKENA